MVRFDIDIGGYLVQCRIKITCVGFNLFDIRNLFFRELEFKLYRRVINGKMWCGGYLKIVRCQFNFRRCCRCGNSERYRRRIVLLFLRIYRSDCQFVVFQCQLCEVVCGFRRSGRVDQSFIVVVRCYGQTEQEIYVFYYFRCVLSCQYLIFFVVCSDFCGQVLYCWWCDIIYCVILFVVKVCFVIYDGFFFRYMLYGGDGIRVVVVFTDIYVVEQSLVQCRQFQFLYVVFSNIVRNTVYFYFYVVGDGLNFYVDRIVIFVNQVYQCGIGGWQCDFTVECQCSGLVVYRQYTIIGVDIGIVIIVDFNNIVRYMVKFFCVDVEIYGLCFQQFCFNQLQFGVVCLFSVGIVKGIYFRNITIVTGNGLCIFNKFCRRFLVVVRVNLVYFNGIMVVFQGVEVVVERCVIIRYYYIIVVIGLRFIRRSVLYERQCLFVLYRYIVYRRVEIVEYILRFTLCGQVRIIGDVWFRVVKVVRY